ncbi:hypothetical protein C6Y28_01475 [Megasphaera elsdenii]|uniref:Uncharacterized protein n=1 Tax=Megasphaera elsdenii TaxID=907 RepID=A0A2S0M4L5_MEGEL|nr:hypothetical protein C6Y28_01475 [Megasphaera elsdenii]
MTIIAWRENWGHRWNYKEVYSMDRDKKEPCGDMAKKDNHYSIKSFIRIKVFHGMKHDGLRNLFEVAKKKAIRNQKK